MRITNKIMQNNSLSNINTNKILQDKLNTQMITESKITRPSDDPVIAIRALRLRTTLAQLTQYKEQNVKDAEAWLKATEGALDTVVSVVEEMYKQYSKGSSTTLNTENRQAILEDLKGLRDEWLNTGEADFAGRNVFTGYRTDTKLRFNSASTDKYRITEQLDRNSIETFTYVNTDNLGTVNSTNYNDSAHQTTELMVSDKEVTRIRLAYDKLNNGYTPQITDSAGNAIRYTDNGGNPANVTVQTKSLYGTDNPYETLGDDDAFFVPETGELLLGKNVAAALSGMADNPLTQNVDEGEFRISYEKNDWDKGDLNPVHYFACSKMDAAGTAEKTAYNGGWQTGQFENQAIEYDVGFNQKIQINTYADECFNHDISRDVNEIIAVLEEIDNMEAASAELDKVLKANSTDAAALERKKAVDKALTMLNGKIEQMFSGGLTDFQGYLDDANQASTNNGSRSSRLELVEKRLTNQVTTFDNLAAENEKADTTKLAVELTSAELSYEAALLATGKIVQTSLLNFL